MHVLEVRDGLVAADGAADALEFPGCAASAAKEPLGVAGSGRGRNEGENRRRAADGAGEAALIVDDGRIAHVRQASALPRILVEEGAHGEAEHDCNAFVEKRLVELAANGRPERFTALEVAGHVAGRVENHRFGSEGTPVDRFDRTLLCFINAAFVRKR